MKSNLSLTPIETQRCVIGPKTSVSPFALLAQTRSNKPLRISRPAMVARPVLRGDRLYLRALRAAEMDAWQAGRTFVASNFKF